MTLPNCKSGQKVLKLENGWTCFDILIFFCIILLATLICFWVPFRDRLFLMSTYKSSSELQIDMYKYLPLWVPTRSNKHHHSMALKTINNWWDKHWKNMTDSPTRILWSWIWAIHGHRHRLQMASLRRWCLICLTTKQYLRVFGVPRSGNGDCKETTQIYCSSLSTPNIINWINHQLRKNTKHINFHITISFITLSHELLAI